MSAPDPRAVRELKRVLLRQLVEFRRFERGESADVDAILARAFRQVQRDLLTTAEDVSPLTKLRLAALLRRYGDLLGERYADAAAHLSGNLQGFAEYQATQAAQLVRWSTAVVGARIGPEALSQFQIDAIARYPVQGAGLEKWFLKLAQDAQWKIRTQLQLGMLRGEGVPELARRILATDKTGKVFGVAGQARAQARQVVRTAVASLNHEIHMATFEAQPRKVTDRWGFLASLDERTCAACAALDGKTFAYDDTTAPSIPVHGSCRCVALPVVNWEQFGLTEEEAQALQVPPTRAAMGGPTTARTFEDWLRDQPPHTADAVLGVQKAAMWRRGDIGLGDLLRDDYTTATLAELGAA